MDQENQSTDQPSSSSSSQSNQPKNEAAPTNTSNIPRPAISSIYPEPTAGFGISNSQAAALPGQKPSVDSKSMDKSKVIIILITILGIYIAGSALIGLIGGVRLLSFGIARSTGGILTAIDIVYLIIGAGIIFRRELARIVYIVIAVIGLVLSSIGLYSYFHSVSNASSLQQQSRQLIIASTNKEIANYQSNTSIPANQKAQIIQEIKNTENGELKTPDYPTVIVEKTIGPLIEGYAIAIIPLIFLTRPTVKEEFS
ncbi:MAG TPA: hypothetical protein VMR95_04620 [Candidatus Binatia bacterium]|nr:hypothetical protein [Candidatus Binatia bacterium]